MTKAAEAFRTISEVAEWLGVQTHVLRFWESKFPQITPVKRAGGRRYYRPDDMRLLSGIKSLLHDDGMTIKGAQKVLKDRGVAQVMALSKPLEDDSAEAAPKPASKPSQAKKTASEPDETAQLPFDAPDNAAVKPATPDTEEQSPDAAALAPEPEVTAKAGGSDALVAQSTDAPPVSAPSEDASVPSSLADEADPPVAHQSPLPSDPAMDVADETFEAAPPVADPSPSEDDPIVSTVAEPLVAEETPQAATEDDHPDDSDPDKDETASVPLPSFSRSARALSEPAPVAEKKADSPEQAAPAFLSRRMTAPASPPDAPPPPAKDAPQINPDQPLVDILRALPHGRIPPIQLHSIHAQMCALRDRMDAAQ